LPAGAIVIEAGANYDLLVIGGGINGTGIARDAAGRGLSVLLVEKNDLASATSSWSSKLIHGGLRYLEQYEFRLVAEALAEREILLNIAPHLVKPLRFVMPHVAGLRPRWMIRTGLYLYDHLGRRATAAGPRESRLAGSQGISLRAPPYNAGLKAEFTNGFIYSDCRVDDARLVLANAISASECGAAILTRTECVGAKRTGDGWEIRVHTADGTQTTVTARAIVNASGPWVKHTLNERLRQASRDNVRLVKGSHIVVAKLYAGDHAYILQNDDRRVVFMIPYLESYTLIGTTDVPVSDAPDVPQASAEEIEYLCRAVNRYLLRPVTPADIAWSYAGVRPLYDDGSANPSAVTRDYTLRLDDDAGSAPVLSVFGGKITTYRKLAEHALAKLAPWFPAMKEAWTDTVPLPGGEADAANSTTTKAPWKALPAPLLDALRNRHGARVAHLLLDVKSVGDLGINFGANLYAHEVDYMIAHEWAQSGEDVLYRRSKAGLDMTAAQRATVEAYVVERRRAL
jgi:glycerol-3-phosphate dehydrogenase